MPKRETTPSSGSSSPVQAGSDSLSDPLVDPLVSGEGSAERSGVPEWAQDEYRRESKRTLTASVAEGKIGSVYFDDGSRIRTTHAAGPEGEGSEPGRIVTRFNIDESSAISIFKAAHPRRWESRKRWKYFDQWLAKTLNRMPLDSLPSWVTLVESPEQAVDMSASSSLKLFEVFTNINGRVEGWHPSRGALTKFDTDKQVVSVLNAALAHIAGVQDTNERNTRFYEFVTSRLPDMASLIRKPDEI